MDNAVEVRGLNKYFSGKHVVQDVSITVRTGHVTGFLGPNGSGKTTTLRLLCGLLHADSGSGTVLGMDFIKDRAVIKKNTGYMTQRFSLYDDLTIEENLLFVGRIRELAHYRDLVAESLQKLRLYDRRNQLAGALSGGWKQRLALAACTLHSPRLLLLDEPTAGVDPQARREFWDEIHTLAAQGLTVLVSTHYMDEAERCHDIGYILHGRIIARGTAEEIIQTAGLVTYASKGAESAQVMAALHNAKGVLSAGFFGASVHVSGTDATALKDTLQPFMDKGMHWEETAPSLEDVFIYLMRDSTDARYR